MEIQEQIQIEAAPARLDVNLEELRAALRERLAQYETVVTEDGLKDGKAAAAEINKLKGELARRRKEAADEAKRPIVEFEDAMKGLESECEEARQTLQTQIGRFEEAKREEARAALQAELGRQWDQAGVREEHRRASVDDLAKASALTKKGGLTKAAFESVEARCAEDSARQNTVDNRLANLEARSQRAGLRSPLTAEHVAPFLESNEDVYEAELGRLLDAEAKRGAEAQRREAEAAQSSGSGEAAESMPAGEAEPAANPASEAAAAPAPSESGPEPAADGKIRWQVVVTFEVEVDASRSKQEIEAAYRKRLQDAGFRTFDSVTASKLSEPEAAEWPL